MKEKQSRVVTMGKNVHNIEGMMFRFLLKDRHNTAVFCVLTQLHRESKKVQPVSVSLLW